MAACFSPRTISFLRAIKHNNDREWFKARRETYEREVREPMIAVIARLAEDFQSFAPDLVASPKMSLYRIYRDTRFSEDKKPLKTHAAAVFPHRALPKHEGAGLYFEIAPGGVWAGGGMYAPQTSQLVRLRGLVAPRDGLDVITLSFEVVAQQQTQRLLVLNDQDACTHDLILSYGAATLEKAVVVSPFGRWSAIGRPSTM